MRVYKFIAGLFLLTFFVVLVSSLSHAQDTSSETPEETAAKHGITFPISELGGCENFSACRTFCEDPVNQSTCIDFAKSKGFYEEDPVETKKEGILGAARNELGCDSRDSCMSLCQDSSNFDKCDSFAKRHNLGGGHVKSTGEQQFLEKAKEVLGCDSPSSCMNFCNDPTNRDKCSEFAKQVGIRGGHMEVGPGGCTSEETCSAFCSSPENYEVCSSHSKASGESFSGPGGCSSEESCKVYCTEHPRDCRSEGTYNPQEMCSKTPDCSWDNNRCECIQKGTDYKGDPQDFCRQYPEKCAYDTSSASEQCAKYPGCKWENNTCQCSEGDVRTQSQTQSVPTGYANPQYVAPTHTEGSYDPASECAKTSGCSWTGSTCQCSSQGSSSTQQTTPETQTQSPPQNYTPPSDSGSTGTYTPPSDSGSYTPPSSGVQGAKATGGVLYMLLDFITNLLSR